MPNSLKRALAIAVAWLLVEPFQTLAQPTLTIDRIELLHKLEGKDVYYPPGAAPQGNTDGLWLPGLAERFYLSDGSTPTQGGGGYRLWSHTVQSVAANNGQLEYTLAHPPGDRVLEVLGVAVGSGTGRYAMGEFETTELLVLRAAAGSTTGTLSTWFRLVNLPTEPNWPERERMLYSCDIGDLVPVELAYTLHFTQFSAGNTTFTPTTFDQPFVYTIDGFMNFDQAIKVPEPSFIGLLIYVGFASMCPRGMRSRASAKACPPPKSPGNSA